MEEEREEWMNGIKEEHMKEIKKLEEDKKEIRFVCMRKNETDV